MTYSDLIINQRVKFIGDSVIGKCTGIVLQLFPPDLQDDFPGAIEMKPDQIPDKWPYQTKTFAPWVDNLETLK